MRICTYCNHEKDESCFKKNTSRWCVDCSAWFANYMRKRRKEHPEFHKKYAVRHRILAKKYNTGQGSQRYNRARLWSIKKGCSWVLSKEEFYALVRQPCYYCGEKLPEWGCGLDRKNNDKQYSIDTVVPCCTSCNSIKSNKFSAEQMLKIASFIKTIK